MNPAQAHAPRYHACRSQGLRNSISVLIFHDSEQELRLPGQASNFPSLRVAILRMSSKATSRLMGREKSVRGQNTRMRHYSVGQVRACVMSRVVCCHSKPCLHLERPEIMIPYTDDVPKQESALRLLLCAHERGVCHCKLSATPDTIWLKFMYG